MSVYADTCYIDDAFQQIVKFFGINKDSNSILLKTLNRDTDGEGIFGTTVKRGNLMKQVQEGSLKLERLATFDKQGKYPNLINKIPFTEKIYFGLDAVFSMFLTLFNKVKRYKQSIPQKMVAEMFLMGTFSSYHTKSEAILMSKVADSVEFNTLNSAITMSKDLLKIANGYRVKAYSQNYTFPQFFSKLTVPETNNFPDLDFWPFQGFLIITSFEKTWLLTEKDIARLERLIMGWFAHDMYIKVLSKIEKFKYLTIINDEYKNLVLTRMKKLSIIQQRNFVRALDVNYHLVAAQKLSDIDTLSYEEQVKKAKKPDINGIFSPTQITTLFGKVSLRIALEILSIHKAFPQGDFDYFGMMSRQAELYATKNRITDQNFFDLVKNYYRWLMIQAYYKAHKICPGTVISYEPYAAWKDSYPNVRPELIPVEGVSEINFEGAFNMCKSSYDIIDLVKDKAICPIDISKCKNERELNKLSKQAKNQLLNYVMGEQTFGTDYIYQNFDQAFKDVKAEDKPEAKKPNGRWFFEAETKMRAINSEYEKSVGEYAMNIEGFVQGKGLKEKYKMLNHVTEFIPSRTLVTSLFVSFDIEKFSPKLPIEVHRMIDDQWSEAFGVPEIKRMSEMFTEGKIHYVKRSIHHTMEKDGNDYEGFAGKRLTIYMLAVMRAAMHRLVNKEKMVKTARYAAQIDDGVMRLVTESKIDKDFVAKLRKLLDEYWRKAGCLISWDKTFISEFGVIFLNEIRFANKTVTPGVRAFLKMNNRSQMPVVQAFELFQQTVSTARGAIFANSEPRIVYLYLCALLLDLYRKLNPKSKIVKMESLVWFYAPFELGGAAIPSLITLLGTMDQTIYESCIGTLLAIEQRLPKYAKTVTKITNQKMREIRDQDVVLSEVATRRVKEVMNRDLFKWKLRVSAIGLFNKPVLARFAEAYHVTDTSISESPFIKKFSTEAKLMLRDTQVLAIVDSIVNKVMNVSTAMVMLGVRNVWKITFNSFILAKKVLQTWVN